MPRKPPSKLVSCRSLAALAFPFLVAWPVAAGLCAIRWNWTTRPGRIGALYELALFVISVAPVAAGLTILERVLPYRVDWTVSHEDVRTDAIHLAFNWLGGLSLSRGVAIGTAYMAFAPLSGRRGTGLWPTGWPIVVQLLLALLVAELGHYWLHRCSHQSALLWRFHATHHGAPRLYWFNATRFHLLELVAQGVSQAAPLLVLGCGHQVFLLYGSLTTACGWIQHSNVALRTGPLSWIFSTPELHRWHHSVAVEEGNRNYGAVLVVWDLLFGTFFRPLDRTFTGEIGVSGMPDFPKTYLAQQLSPLRWSRIGSRREKRCP